jgi:hypothetical protein
MVTAASRLAGGLDAQIGSADRKSEPIAEAGGLINYTKRKMTSYDDTR